MMKVCGSGYTEEPTAPDTFDQSTLMAYLGVRGAPIVRNSSGVVQSDVSFQKNALFLLAYWDIYKNYYANKQEEVGYLISNLQVDNYMITEFSTENGGAYTVHPFDENNGTFTTPIHEQFKTLRITYIDSYCNPDDMYIKMSTDDMPAQLVKKFSDVFTYVVNPLTRIIDCTPIEKATVS